jgi:Raf kinase inhibitor-like YbhB/YbcL family protein
VKEIGTMFLKDLRYLCIAGIIALGLITLVGSNGSNSEGDTYSEGDTDTNITDGMQLSSPAFDNGDAIPANYTCDGQNISPPLQWSNIPSGTKSLALLMYRSKGSGETVPHWGLYDIPASQQQLDENIPNEAEFKGMNQTLNAFNELGYGGPCSSSGITYQFYFKLLALDAETLGLQAGADYSDLEDAVESHVLSEAVLMGTYGDEPINIPTAPSNLHWDFIVYNWSGGVLHSARVRLVWSHDLIDVIGFRVERRKAGQTYSEIDTTSGTTYHDTVTVTQYITPTYYWRVRAYNNEGDSLYSNETSFDFSSNITPTTIILPTTVYLPTTTVYVPTTTVYIPTTTVYIPTTTLYIPPP